MAASDETSPISGRKKLSASQSVVLNIQGGEHLLRGALTFVRYCIPPSYTMGLCGSSLTPAEAQALKDEKARAAAIEKDMQRDRKKDQQVHKLLLLGAGESGKSTLFKQLIVLYSGGFSDKDRMAYLPVICNNMIGAMKTLLEQSDRQGSPAQIAPELQSVKAEVLEMKIPDIIDKELAVKVKSLWADPGIQYTYSKRSTFQLIDAASFFFDHVDRYSQPHYVPLEEDVLRCRVRTTGTSSQIWKGDADMLLTGFSWHACRHCGEHIYYQRQ